MAEGLPNDVNIEALKDSVKHEIRRELKIKEGAENLLKAAKDRKSKSQAEHIVKESSDKIEFLRLKLQDLIAQVPDDEGESLIFYIESTCTCIFASMYVIKINILSEVITDLRS